MRRFDASTLIKGQEAAGNADTAAALRRTLDAAEDVAHGYVIIQAADKCGFGSDDIEGSRKAVHAWLVKMAETVAPKPTLVTVGAKFVATTVVLFVVFVWLRALWQMAGALL